MPTTHNIQNYARLRIGLILIGLISAITLPLASTTVAASLKQSDSGSTSSANAQENPLSLNRWSSNGPDGGTVLSLAIDRSNPTTLYAATPTGVFKSKNSGESWSSSLTNAYVQIVAIAPTTPTTVYAGTQSGVFKSTDAGLSWNAVSNGLENQYGPIYIAALAIDPTNSNIIYVSGPDIDLGGTYRAIYKSTDGGGSWNITKHSINPYAIHRTLAIDPINPNIIYAAGSVGNGTVWKSTDNGRFWTIVNVGLDSRSTVYALTIDPTNTNTIYVGTETLGVYKSTDGGASWSPFSDGLDYYYVDDNGQRNFFRVSSIVIDPINPSIVYVGTYHGVYKSSNGASWGTLMTGINLGVNAVAIDAGNTNIMYTGTDGGMFKSSSGGASWSTINNGLRGINVSSLALNIGNADVYAGTYGDTFSSNDNGGNWSVRDFYPLAFDPHNPNTIYARRDGHEGLFKSTNGGATWTSITTGLPDPYVSAVAVDPRNSQVIYTSTAGSLCKSTDGGENWTALANLGGATLLIVDLNNSQTLYAIAYDGFCDDNSVYKSIDGGLNWNSVAGNQSFCGANALIFDAVNRAIIYVSSYFGISKSTDGGEHWSLINSGLPDACASYVCAVSSLAAHPVHPNIVYAGTYGNGVFKSEDGGTSWNPFNDGLANLSITTLAIDSLGNFLHAGTSSGVFDIQLQSNQLDDAQFFVRQHYRDFLNREPDAGGLAYWTNQIAQCASDVRCIHERRIGVSAAFFIELEFQDTGYYVYRFYKASFGRQPTFAEFTSDRSKVIGGSSLEANKQAFADEWVQRTAFTQAYSITMSNTEVVSKLFDSAGLTASIYDAQRQQEVQAMNAGRSRALVLRDVIEIPGFKNIPDPNDPRYSEIKQTSQYNPAFVLMQYFGYLKRNVDRDGYDFWLDVVNNREPNNYHGMVCSFITSTEYQLRFGSVVTRSNADCSQ